jgi:hypothetical protein
MRPLRRLLPAILLLVLAAFPVAPALLAGHAMGPFDQIQQMAPWNGPKPAQPWDVLQADGVLQFFGWRDLVFEAWRTGGRPYWNPYQLAGTPLLANSQSGGFYPPHIVMGLAGVPTASAITLLAWFHLFWTALGVYLLVRALGGSRPGGVFAASAFIFSPFVLGWLALPSVLSTVSWIPWILACLIALFSVQTSARKRAAELSATDFSEEELTEAVHEFARSQQENTSKLHLMTAALAASVGMMLLAGHLQFAAYGMMAAGLALVMMVLNTSTDREMRLGIVEVITLGPDGTQSVSRPGPVLGAATRLAFHPAMNGLLRAILGLAGGALIAAPQILPVLEYSQFSHRRAAPSEAGYQGYNASAISVGDFLQRLVNPFSQGSPVTPFGDSGFSTFWPVLAKTGANFAESATTVGAPVVLLLCLLALARVAWRTASAVVAVGVLALLLALGSPLNATLYFNFPGWSATGSPGRAIVLFVLAACVLGGLGVAEKLREAAPRSLGIALAAYVVICALTLRPAAVSAPGGMNPEAWASLLAAGPVASLPGLALILLGGGLLAFGMTRIANTQAALWSLAALPAIGFLVMGLGSLVRHGSADFLRPPTERSFQRIAVINDPWGLAAAAPALLPPNTATPTRRYDLGGYDSLLHRETVATLANIVGGDPAPPANGNMMFIKPTADPAKLAAAGVVEVWSRNPLPWAWDGTADAGFTRYPLSGPGRVSLESGTADIVADSTQSIRIQINGSGSLVLRDRNLPGWAATVDGIRVPIAPGIWRTIDVPQGAKVVEFRYEPPGLSTGLRAAALGILISVGFLVAGGLARRRVLVK